MEHRVEYVVIYTQKGKRIGTSYDEMLNYLGEYDPDSAHANELLQDVEDVEGLDDEMWDDVLGELTPEERRSAKAYRLNHTTDHFE